MLIDNEPRNGAAAMAFCDALATLNNINIWTGKIALDKFYVDNLREKIDIVSDYLNWSFNNVGSCFPFFLLPWCHLKKASILCLNRSSIFCDVKNFRF